MRDPSDAELPALLRHLGGGRGVGARTVDLAAQVADQDVRPLLGQGQGDGASNAAAAPRHDRAPAFESVAHLGPPDESSRV